MMNKYCMIETAFDNKEELEKITTELLNKKLVSSCQVVESKSSWNWKGKLEKSKEYLVFMKTKKNFTKEIYNTIKKYHSYECFEFAIFNLESTSKEYLEWIDKETKKEINLI